MLFKNGITTVHRSHFKSERMIDFDFSQGGKKNNLQEEKTKNSCEHWKNISLLGGYPHCHSVAKRMFPARDIWICTFFPFPLWKEKGRIPIE